MAKLRQYSLLLALLFCSLSAYSLDDPSEMETQQILTELIENNEEVARLLKLQEQDLNQRESNLNLREQRLNLRDSYLNQRESDLEILISSSIAIGSFSASLRQETEGKLQAEFWRGFGIGFGTGFGAGFASGVGLGVKIRY